MNKLDHNYLKYYQLKENDVILDLGASTGEFGKYYEKEIIDKNCTLICVEPSPWCLHHLTIWADKIPNVVIISSATSKDNGLKKFNITNSYHINSLEEHVQNDLLVKFNEPVKFTRFVPSYSLDFILHLIDKKINFLKCDIEGGEVETFLNCFKLDQIENFAIASYHIYNNQKTYEILLPFFKKIGFEVIHEGKPEDMLYIKVK